MIVGSEEYKEFLTTISKSYTPLGLRMRVAIDDKVYKIDLNTREVEVPTFLGVEADHEAEIIYFEMDRYFDSIDLASCIGLVQYKNAKNEEYYYVIPYFDVTSRPGKIIFPWDIQCPLTKYAGNVSFAFKFFKVDAASEELLYDINTKVIKSKVLVGWGGKGADHTYSQITAEDIMLNNDFFARLQNLEQLDRDFAIYWEEV